MKDKLAKDGYDPVYGARPLRRTIESQLENVLAQQLIAGRIKKGDHVIVTLEEGRIVTSAATLTSQPVPANQKGSAP